MGANSSPPTNVRRAAVGLIGLVLGLVVILVGLNLLSGSDAPPEDTPRVQTGSLPTGTARDGGVATSAPPASSAPTTSTGSR